MKPNPKSLKVNTKVPTKKSSPPKTNGQVTEKGYRLFSEGNLPPHHFDTVKAWVQTLIDKTAGFSKKLDNNANKSRESKLFHSKYFNLEDVNELLKNFYNTIDSTISGLNELQASIGDYIATWKVALAEGIDSCDSSIEECIQIEPEVVVKEDEESKDSVKSDSLPRIRIRKICELNKLTAADLSASRGAGIGGQSNSKDSVKKDVKISSSSSDECIICSNDEEDTKPKNTNDLSPTKKIINIDSDSSVENLHNNSSKNKSKAEIDSSSSDDVCVISESEIQKPKNEIKKQIPKTVVDLSKSDPEKKTEPKSDKQLKINWDTSSSVESERSWVLTNKKKKKLNKEEKDKRKTTKERKEKASDDMSSSEDECAKLLNIKNLKKRRRVNSDSESVESSECSKKVQKGKTKIAKTGEEPSVMDFIGSTESESSEVSDFELNFSFTNTLKTLSSKCQMEPKVDDFGKIISDEEDCLDVLTDSSLDSLVRQLAGKVKVNRGTSKTKKENKDEEPGTQEMGIEPWEG